MTKADDTPTTPPAVERRRVAHPAGGVAEGRAPARRALLTAPAALLALATLSTAATAQPSPDTILLALGARFEAAWTAETAAWDAAGDVFDDHPAHIHAAELGDLTAAIVDEIERATATTLPGMLVKGRALRWCSSGDAPTHDLFDSPDPRVPRRTLFANERLILSMLVDLHALTGGPL